MALCDGTIGSQDEVVWGASSASSALSPGNSPTSFYLLTAGAFGHGIPRIPKGKCCSARSLSVLLSSEVSGNSWMRDRRDGLSRCSFSVAGK